MASVVRKAHADAVDWIPVVSTNVKALAYSPALQLAFIEFKSGQRGCYHNMPQSVFDAWIVAQSPGGYLYHVVRNGGKDDLYGYEKL